MSKKVSKRISVSVSKEDLDKVKKDSKEHGQSISQITSGIIHEHYSNPPMTLDKVNEIINEKLSPENLNSMMLMTKFNEMYAKAEADLKSKKKDAESK